MRVSDRLPLLSTIAAVAMVSRVITSNAAEPPGNPIFPGWYADPEGVIFDNTCWIYPTSSAPYAKQLQFDAFSSPDLVKWTKHENILTTTEIKWAKNALWAPSILRKNGKYFLFFSANNIQSDREKGGIGIAVAAKPEGPYRDYLGKPLVDQIHNGAQPIDQYVFKDTDGSYYLIYGGWDHCNMAKLKDDFTGFIPQPDGTIFKEITPKGYVEGPCLFARNGKYYFMWSEGNWQGPDYCVAYAVADSPFGPFTRIGKVLQQDPTIATGAGHHSVIQLPDKDRWFTIYHRRPLTETDANSREICIDEMRFDEKGLIQPVKITVLGVQALEIK